jgi:hypothetical protein
MRLRRESFWHGAQSEDKGERGGGASLSQNGKEGLTDLIKGWMNKAVCALVAGQIKS